VDLQQKIADILQRLEDLKAPQLSSSTAPVSVGSITQFVTFGGFVNAVTADGSVLCWDSLGVRTISYRVLLLCNLKSVASIAPGDDHSCAVKKDGSAICWGHNYYGQLGNGTFDDKATQIPVSVSGLGPGTTASITVGSSHTCALKTDGSVVCWGNNNSSQLGDGTLEGRFTPVQVVGLGPGTTATLFTSDGGSTCAQKTNGSIVCWGQNSLIGYDNHTAPVQATQFAAGTVESLDFSFKRSCVLKTDGSVVCSGSNYCGQLGNNQGKNAVTLGPGTAVAVSNGEFHSCALKRDGSVVCWGCNENGQVGDGTVTNRYIPVQVSGLGPGTTAAISAHFLNTCALKTDGVVVCWPYGGKEGEKSSRTPVLAPSLTGQ
jgi:alpha-tubulin suppressor-like RCC1 family protein